jgi:two-component system chemotaxis response regulator CheY
MPELADLSVLLVEDQPQSRQLIAKMLSTLGISRLTELGGGADAIALLTDTAETFDIVLCDWMMPEIDGMAVLLALKEHRPGLPFLMLTARADSASVSEAILAGVSGYLRKPFGLQDLRERLQPYASRR